MTKSTPTKSQRKQNFLQDWRNHFNMQKQFFHLRDRRKRPSRIHFEKTMSPSYMSKTHFKTMMGSSSGVRTSTHLSPMWPGFDFSPNAMCWFSSQFQGVCPHGTPVFPRILQFSPATPVFPKVLRFPSLTKNQDLIPKFDHFLFSLISSLLN